MKYVVFLILNILFATQAFAGNGGPGGGNFLRSSETEVLDALQQSDVAFGWLVREINAELNPENSIRIRSRGLKDIFTRMSQLDEFTQAVTGDGVNHKYVRFEPQSKDACYFDGVKKESSIRRDENGNAIMCLSIPLLRHYPVEALVEQIAALRLHELGHLSGSGEYVDTEIIQKFAIRLLENDCSVTVNLPDSDEGYQRRINIVFYFSNMNRHENYLGFNSDTSRLVDFNEYFPPGKGDIHSEAILAVDQRSARLNSKGSKIDFTYRNADGSLSQGSVSFGPLEKHYLPGSTTYYNIESSGPVHLKYKWLGKKLESTGVSVSTSCFK